ncbi:ABC transporter permease [Bifidobacterium simiarum]|uniref:ABC transporter permease n=1 Tax=Bifidobacterium simiarum TaxID=2045441 RepID=UPI001BDC144F|nr:ABC transporter permease [Bifidobacterium simiarum]MBT1165217.1 ABC transporter permease [Bifidobacterium simiarum]
MASTKRRRSRRLRTPLSRGQRIAAPLVTFAVLLALWALVTETGMVDPLFLPSPSAVAQALVDQAAQGALWTDIGTSVYRITVGYLIAVVMAVPLGVMMGVNEWVLSAVEPLMDFIRYMPVVAFVPLTIIWAGTDDLQKFLIIWMGTFFQLVLLVCDAVMQVPQNLIDFGETLGMRKHDIIMRIVFPSSLPRIWDALRVSLGWAWTWLVVAELVAATSGLGYRITVSQRYFATDVIIGYVVVLGILGLFFDQVMRAIGKRAFKRWEGRS